MVEPDAEHQPADHVGRQDRGGDHLVRRAAEADDAGRFLGVVEGLEEGGPIGPQALGVVPDDMAVLADEEGRVDADPRLQVLKAGIDGGRIARGDGGRAFAQPIGPERPNPVEHRPGGRQFGAHLALRSLVDRHVDARRDQQQHHAEEGDVEYGQTCAETIEHGRATGFRCGRTMAQSHAL